RSLEGDPWPDVSDGALLEDIRRSGTECWLAPWLDGISRRQQFASVDLGGALHALLPYELSRRLEKEAPEVFTVPSGSTVRIDYLEEGGPALAAKLQEMFGQPTSPAVCGGRCPLTLKLLSPAGRPLQITRALAGFWAGAYASVRAEMRGRYPKHPWPEDPAAAVPTRKTNRALARESGGAPGSR
ncbi:MAG: ATP-dependent helicase HrpB, partial [Mailhella sp.]|nr:ATP-dependent helicase HrpB [Mailhella sp.]